MQIIKTLAHQIKEELHDAEKYAKLAIEHKADHPALAGAYYRLSNEELEHMNILHTQAVQMIDKAKNEKVVPPVMFELWAWKHEEMIEEEKGVRLLLDMYSRK